jgi:hypothetical protein
MLANLIMDGTVNRKYGNRQSQKFHNKFPHIAPFLDGFVGIHMRELDFPTM